MSENGYRVLVKEKIADAGVDLLRRHFDVDVLTDMGEEDLPAAIGSYDAIVIRSATKLTADVIDRADRLKVIGRAGIGVDNVDVPAATKRGIIVANAPESNIIAAAEHTIAMMLAQVRNIPQADASLKDGKWERSKFGGVEVYEKTLGILGFGRIGQLVAERARAFGMNLLAYDPYVAAERYRELGVERADSPEDLYARSDVITVHLPKTPDTIDYVNAEAFAQMKDGVRIVNCARGELIDLAALEDAIKSGKVAGASLDVFPGEPVTEHSLFAYDNVVVTPHLGASTAEAQDRAGVITAEQVVAALNGDLVSNAVNIPKVGSDDLAVLEPYLPLCAQLGRLAMSLAEHPSVDRIEVAYRGHLADFDTRLLTLAVLNGAFEGRVEEHVNFVNAPAIAEERGHPRGGVEREPVPRLREPRRRGGARGRRALRGSRHDLRPAERAAPRVRLRPELQHRAGAQPRDLPLLGPARDDRQGRHGVRRARDQHRLDRGRAGARPRAGRARGRRHRPPRRDGGDRRLAGPGGGDRRDHRARRLRERPRRHAVGAAMARVAAIVPDLFFASKVKETLTAAGHDVVVVPAGAPLEADLVIVDLDAAGTDVERPSGTPSLGFYSHVETETRTRAQQAGFDLVVPRSRMAREMPELVAGLLGSA